MSEAAAGRRRMALLVFAGATFLSFPHELPWGGSFDLGLLLFWLGPAALVVGIEGLAPRRAAGAAFAASLVGHALVFHWFFVVTVVYGGMPWGLGVLAPLLPALYVSIFTALFAWLWARVVSPGTFPVLLGGVLWVAVDWLRGHLLGGFPWATLGYALHLDVPLLGITRWMGVYGLSFLAAVVGIAVAGFAYRRDVAARRALLVSLLALAGAHGPGLLPLAGGADGEVQTVRIAAVQGNIDQGEKWDEERRDRIFGIYERLSAEAIAQGAEWVVWPETSVPGLIEADSGLSARLSRLVRKSRADFVVGAMGIAPDATGTRIGAFFDSAFVLDPLGRIVDRYDKTHLVPFGEFVPLRGLLGHFFKSLASGLSTTDVTPGFAPRVTLVDRAGGGEEPLRVGVPICYELLFPDLVRRFAADRAGVLLAITNDAWYGRTGAPHQFLAMTALRAAENGLWTVRAANTGISALIDARGRVREASPLFEEAVLVGEIPVVRDARPTFYARHGDVFAWLCIVGSAGAVGRSWLVGRRRRNGGNPPTDDPEADGPGRVTGEGSRDDE